MGARIWSSTRPISYSMTKSNLGLREGEDCDGELGRALAGSMEEALERQQEAAEASATQPY